MMFSPSRTRKSFYSENRFIVFRQKVDFVMYFIYFFEYCIIFCEFIVNMYNILA